MKIIKTRKFIILIFIIFVTFLISFIYRYRIIYDVKEIFLSDRKMINDIFKVNITNDMNVVGINEYSDGDLGNVMEVKLTIPSDKVDLFLNGINLSKGKDIKKIPLGVLRKSDIKEEEFDYDFILIEDSIKNNLIYEGRIQKNTYIIISKTINGKVKVFMETGRLGWGNK